MFRSLRVRNFRLYASANLVSNTGTWMQRIGQDWLVLQLSGDSGVALGLITALQFGPTLFLSMYGGVLGDRYEKRRLLMLTQGSMGVLALILGALVGTGAIALWHVFVLAMVLAFVIGTFGFNYQVTIALMATNVFGLGAQDFGLLSTAFAVGSLTGALLSTRRSARPRQRFLVVSSVVFGLLTVVSGLMPSYAAFAVMLVPTGASALVFSVAANSFVQLGADPQMRGRVMALYFMCFMGGTPVGAPLIGWVAENLGAPAGLIAGGAVVVVSGVGAGVWL